MSDTVIYGKDACPYTTAARKDYEKRGVLYSYVDVLADRAALEEMLAKSGGRREVPVIDDDGSITVGFGGS